MQLHLERQVSSVGLGHGDSSRGVLGFLYFEGVFAIGTDPRDPKSALVVGCRQQLEFLGLQVDPGIGSGRAILEGNLSMQGHILTHAGVAVGVHPAHGARDVAGWRGGRQVRKQPQAPSRSQHGLVPAFNLDAIRQIGHKE